MLKSTRATVTISGLEKTITAAVQQSTHECQAFVGVYIEHSGTHQSGKNWSVKGVKYGRAPRAACDAAIDSIVSNLQDRYVIESVGLTPSLLSVPVAAGGQRSPINAVSPLAAALKRISQRP